GLRQPGGPGGGRGHEPDSAWWAILHRCRRCVSRNQLAAALDPDGGLQRSLITSAICRASRFGVLPRHTRGFAPPYPPSRFRSSGHGADRIRLRSAAHVLLGATLAVAGGAARGGDQRDMGPGDSERSATALGVPE